jgi:hypothetical protein
MNTGPVMATCDRAPRETERLTLGRGWKYAPGLKRAPQTPRNLMSLFWKLRLVNEPELVGSLSLNLDYMNDHTRFLPKYI